MKKKLSKAHPVAVRVIYNMKPKTSPTESAPAKRPIVASAPKTPVPVTASVVPPLKSGEKKPELKTNATADFVRPKESKKFFPFKKYSEVLSKFTKKNRVGLSIAGLVVVVVAAVMIFVVPRILYRSSIPSFLPENTIAFVGVSIDPLNFDVRHLFSDLKVSLKDSQIADAHKDSIISGLNIPKDTNIQKGLTREAGVALFNGEEGVAKTLILHIADPKNAKALLDKISENQTSEEKKYKGFTIVTLRAKDDPTKAISYLYTHQYVFLTEGSTGSFTLADIIHKDQPALTANEAYRKLVSKSRATAAARIFIDSSRISQLEGVVNIPSSLKSFLSLMDNESMYLSVYEKSGALAYDLIFPRDTTKKDEMKSLVLMPQLTTKTLATLEGPNFQSDWKDFETALVNSEPLLAFYFSNIQKRLNDSFSFDFQNDFLKYFQKGYALNIDSSVSRSKNTGKPFQNVSLVLELKDVNAFRDAEPGLSEKIKSILSSQFQNQPVALTQEDYAGLTLNVFSGDGMPVNIYYIVHDNKLFVSTNKSFFDNINDPTQGSVSGLASYKALSVIKTGTPLHSIFVNFAAAPEDLIPKSIQVISDGMLVRDTQKGDNAVVTGLIHFIAK